MVSICLPSNLQLENVLSFSSEMHALPDDDLYEFDFGGIGWFPPFSMLYLAAQLRVFRQARPDARCRALHFDTLSYPAHMGFFQMFGLEHGNAPGQASGSETHVPINRINCIEVNETALRTGLFPGEIAQNKAEGLAQIVTRGETGPVYDFIAYSLREILRNSIEHSLSSEAFYCAQYWPYLRQVEIGVLDLGVGINTGLAQNPNFRSLTDTEALRESLKPGVSGKIYEGAPPQSRSEWENSGWGLYLTSELIAKFGSFFIASGDGALERVGTFTHTHPSQLSGTAVRLMLLTRELPAFAQTLAELREQGRSLSGDRAPSAISTRL